MNHTAHRSHRFMPFAWLLALGISLAWSAPPSPAPAAGALDDASCLACHAKDKPAINLEDAKGKKRVLHAVTPEKFAASVPDQLLCRWRTRCYGWLRKPA